MEEIKLHSERLNYRILQDSDIPELFDIIQKYPEIADLMTWNPPKDLDEAKQKLLQTRDESDLNFGIFEDKNLIGRMTVRNFQEAQQDARKDSAFISFWLSPESQGKGFGTEALKTICDFCFTEKNLRKIFAGFFEGNIGSERLLQKVGFHKIGLLKKHYLKNGVYYNSIRYECLREDLKQ